MEILEWVGLNEEVGLQPLSEVSERTVRSNVIVKDFERIMGRCTAVTAKLQGGVIHRWYDY